MHVIHMTHIGLYHEWEININGTNPMRRRFLFGEQYPDKY